MAKRSRARTSLSVRIAILVFVASAGLLGAFAFTVHSVSDGLARESFETALRARAEAVASLVEDDEHDEGLELEHATALMARFAGKSQPDLFVVADGRGRVVAKSRSLTEMPAADAILGPRTAVYRDFEHGGRRYRAIHLLAVCDSEERHGKTFLVRVFFAASTHDLEARLDRLARLLTWLTLAGLVTCAGLSGLVAWRGLAPLRRLAGETGGIGDANLDRRLTRDGLPGEIHTVADAVNGLLGRLEEAFDRERRFSSDAAHELRTPVATLKASIQAALLDAPDSERDRQTLEDLLVDVERLADLCDALLLVSSTRAAADESDLPAEAWRGEIEEAFRSLAANGHAGTARLRMAETEAPPPGLVLAAGLAATGRIATNLIQNALRHAGENAEIEVAVTWWPDGARLTVEDDGPGVAPEHREKLFDRFYRADRARARATGGAGLGLAICRSLAEAAGGSIEFEPVEPHGARFIWTVNRYRS